jgi:hypothetical protein
MFKWLKPKKQTAFASHRERAVRIILAEQSPLAARKKTEATHTPSKNPNHTVNILNGSSIGALIGLVLVGLALQLGLKPPIPEMSVMVLLPLLGGAFTAYVVS